MIFEALKISNCSPNYHFTRSAWSKQTNDLLIQKIICFSHTYIRSKFKNNVSPLMPFGCFLFHFVGKVFFFFANSDQMRLNHNFLSRSSPFTLTSFFSLPPFLYFVYPHSFSCSLSTFLSIPVCFSLIPHFLPSSSTADERSKRM